jgi:hypothetical protein
MIFDEWQKRVLETKGNIVLCSGRQVGKSTIIAKKAGDYALNNRNKSVLIISSTERQAEELFIKVLNFITDKDKSAIKSGKDRPTKHIMRLKNGSIIRCLPTGLAGTGIRGYTIDLLIADEAAFIGDDVFITCTPMLLTTGGDIVLVSTPFGRKGYFYDCYKDPNFTVFHINSEECIRTREISVSWTQAQQDNALKFLESEKRKMSQLQYAQEYMGEFVDSLRQFFPDELIKKCMKAKRPERINKEKTYFLGVDVARLGEDESTFEIIDRTNRDNLVHVENLVTTKTRINETVALCLSLDRKYDFKKVYIDDGGVGGGVFDYLLAEAQTKRKVEAINNSTRSLDKDNKRKTSILKEDLYNNLLLLMEMGKIELLDDDEVFLSFKSVQFEYTMEKGEPTRLRIFGNYTHIVEGLIRAAWCNKDKTLNIWCAYK